MFKRIIAALSIGLAMAACGGQAQAAAPTSKTYVSSAGQVASLHNAMVVDSTTTPGMVIITYINNSQAVFNDSGVLINRILTKNPHFVQIPGTGKWLNPNAATSISCQNGVTNVSIFGSGIWGYNDPGCAMYAQIKANSN